MTGDVRILRTGCQREQKNIPAIQPRTLQYSLPCTLEVAADSSSPRGAQRVEYTQDNCTIELALDEVL